MSKEQSEPSITDGAMMEVRQVTLAGRHVRLVPMAPYQEEPLRSAAADGELWRLWYASGAEPHLIGAEIARRILLLDAGSMLPFAVQEEESGTLVGMTTFMNIDRTLRRVEIGSTWYARRVQRTAVNTEAKLLLLDHAFESLGCLGVEFRTHFLNQPSRRAIERLGARLDGVLRSHRRARDGTLGDTAVYSIVASEWPAVRSHLRWQLERAR